MVVIERIAPLRNRVGAVCVRVCRKKTAAAIEISPQLFYAGGKMETQTQEKKELVPSEKEKALLNLLRGIGYGEVRVIVQAGVPVRAEEIRKSIQL